MPITCRLYQGGQLREHLVDPERAAKLAEERGARVWMDMENPTEEELELLRDRFGLHPLTLEDVRHRGQRPKLEFYEGYFFLVVHSLSLDPNDELVDSEVHALVGHRFLITIRHTPVHDIEEVIRRWDRQPELTFEGAGSLLYAVLDEIVDGYFDVLERYEDLSEDIEEGVFAEEPDTDLQQKIFALKRRVVVMRRLVVPLRDVLDRLLEQPSVVTAQLQPYYRDVLDHVMRAMEFADNIRELLSAALEAQISQVSNRLNQVMKQLTAWASMILLPTLIAGIYGMNFDHMPELHWLLGYPFALGLMAAAVVALYVMFKRREWL
jgi:magnesium transporter